MFAYFVRDIIYRNQIKLSNKLSFSGGEIMKRPASLVVGIILLFLACAQLCRFFLNVPVIAAGIEIPLWPSAVAAAVLFILGIWLLKERKI